MSNLHNTKQEGGREGGCITIWPVKIWGKRITLGEGDGGHLLHCTQKRVKARRGAMTNCDPSFRLAQKCGWLLTRQRRGH